MMMVELEEYCHDVADERKDIEDVIVRRELQDAWIAHDRQCAANGDVTPAMRQTKRVIQQLQQRLLNRITSWSAAMVATAHLQKETRGSTWTEGRRACCTRRCPWRSEPV